MFNSNATPTGDLSECVRVHLPEKSGFGWDAAGDGCLDDMVGMQLTAEARERSKAAIRMFISA